MYLEIDEGFDSHPKTVRLCRVMGDVNAGQYLIRIWAWACRSAPDGDLSGMEAQDVEAIAKYSKADGRLFTVLTETWSPKFGPWIDSDGTTLKLHGWGERQGAAIGRMNKRAAYMRDARERRRESRLQERDCNVPVTRASRDLTVSASPDQSSPDQTRPVQTSIDLGSCPETAKPSSVPAVLVFPCDGETNSWALTQSQIDEWAKLFPAVPILTECRAALAWVKASPQNRKTAKGMARFLVGWFGRTQNSGKARQQATAPTRIVDHSMDVVSR